MEYKFENFSTSAFDSSHARADIVAETEPKRELEKKKHEDQEKKYEDQEEQDEKQDESIKSTQENNKEQVLYCFESQSDFQLSICVIT